MDGATDLDGTEVVGAFQARLGHRHAKRALGVLNDILDVRGYSVEDLSLIGVGRGPGGFTGIRVGLATAVGLSLSTGAGVWPVDSLAVLACGVQGHRGVVVPLFDARRSEVYGGAYRLGPEGHIESVYGPVVAPIDRVLEDVKSYLKPDEEPLIIGSGAIAYSKQSAVCPSVHVPSGVVTARLAAQQWLSADRTLASAPPVDPVYVRPSDAELNAKR